MNEITIIGASGHGKVVADIAEKSGFGRISFLDDANVAECAGLPVVGKTGDAFAMGNATDSDGSVFVVAIGNAVVRERIQGELEAAGKNMATLVHPAAAVSRRVTIGAGSVLVAGSVVNSDAVLGRGCIVNTCASVDHDCRIGDFVHVAVGAHIAGASTVGDRTWIGAGATVSNNVSICADCMIGAGAAVVHDITEPGTYVGVPARKMER